MRSRYSAFALKKTAYLLSTWHSTTRPAHLTFDGGEEWVQLRVLAATTDGDTATVEFIARSRHGGHVASLHEVSRFVREDGQWFYMNGTIKDD
jgi:SEC-C motif-containing protein